MHPNDTLGLSQAFLLKQSWFAGKYEKVMQLGRDLEAKEKAGH